MFILILKAAYFQRRRYVKYFVLDGPGKNVMRMCTGRICKKNMA